VSLIEHEMICWDCHGSGVVASEDAKPIPCPLCQDDYGRLKVVPASQLRGAVDTLREFAEWVRDYPYSQPAHRERAQTILDALGPTGGQ
jgi:hypothetical protein